MDIPYISAIVAVAGVLVGVALTVLQLRDLVRTRQTDVVLRSHSIFGSREFQEAWVGTLQMEFDVYKDYLKKYGAASEKPVFVSVNMVASFFEDIGILLHRKLADIALIDDLFNSDVMITWHKLNPIVQGWRKQFNRPQMSEWFEYLYNEMQKREQKLARGE